MGRRHRKTKKTSQSGSNSCSMGSSKHMHSLHGGKSSEKTHKTRVVKHQDPQNITRMQGQSTRNIPGIKQRTSRTSRKKQKKQALANTNIPYVTHVQQPQTGQKQLSWYPNNPYYTPSTQQLAFAPTQQGFGQDYYTRNDDNESITDLVTLVHTLVVEFTKVINYCKEYQKYIKGGYMNEEILYTFRDAFTDSKNQIIELSNAIMNSELSVAKINGIEHYVKEFLANYYYASQGLFLFINFDQLVRIYLADRLREEQQRFGQVKDTSRTSGTSVGKNGHTAGQGTASQTAGQTVVGTTRGKKSKKATTYTITSASNSSKTETFVIYPVGNNGPFLEDELLHIRKSVPHMLQELMNEHPNKTKKWNASIVEMNKNHVLKQWYYESKEGRMLQTIRTGGHQLTRLPEKGLHWAGTVGKTARSMITTPLEMATKRLRKMTAAKATKRIVAAVTSKTPDKFDFSKPHAFDTFIPKPKTVNKPDSGVTAATPGRKYKEVPSIYGTLVVHQVPGDGNCQFFAIAEQTAISMSGHVPDMLQLKTRSNSIREVAVEYIRNNKEDFKDFIEHPETIDTYIKRMENNGEWGDQATLVALANANKISIYVFVETPTTKDINLLLFEPRHQPDYMKKFRPYFLFYSGENHYDSITDIKETSL